ncbi:transmembrane protein, putative [Medicago truncatula]|uniref:Transmembrane protein, putative n=1 Tax=Medicago truncatula TaxID=3880 RepID=G7KML7_MEDTR|nr:transmembrane protein, putative [Medicago truncatula]
MNLAQDKLGKRFLRNTVDDFGSIAAMVLDLYVPDEWLFCVLTTAEACIILFILAGQKVEYRKRMREDYTTNNSMT